MGAWGVGIFDNDDAADWVWELSAHGLDAVEAALDAATGAGYLEAPEGARALAAADVVARLRSGGGEVTPHTQDVVAWIAQNSAPPSTSLVERALAALVRVRGGESELHELWADTGGELSRWLAVLSEVEARLTA